jgi:xanthine dehydrogenase accessory factor
VTASSRAPHPALAAWTALRDSGASRGALVTLVRAEGGAARSVGTHFALADDGRAFGSVTIGGCADGRALGVAAEVLRDGARRLLTLPLGEEDAVALGLGCAGEVELLIDAVGTMSNGGGEALDIAGVALARGERVALLTPLEAGTGRVAVAEGDGPARPGAASAGDEVAHALASAALHGEGAAEGVVRDATGARWLVQLLLPACTLLIVGATDVAAALCALAASLGWRAVLIDPRDALLAEPRFATAAERRAGMPAEVVAAGLVPGAAVVVVAHDYKIELPVLREALRSGASYVGMLGSRKRGAALRAMLADDGLTPEEIGRLHSPIGLAIGAQGAAEIAVSIAAELIAAWRGASR